jgi:Protein of unknown function (DUF4239)
MNRLLLSLPTWLMGVIVIGGCVGLALAGMAWVRKHVPSETLVEGKDSAGVTFAVIAGFYGVLAAFVVVAVWGQFDKARESADREASVIGDVYRMVQVFPEASSDSVRRAARGYVEAVIRHEWAAMADLKTSAQAEQQFVRFWDSVLALQPKGQRENAAYGVLLEQLTSMSDHRGMRLISASQSIPGLLWVLLLVGAVLTIGSSFFLVTRHGGLHTMLTLALTTSIAFVLFLILALDYPFTGSVAVTPEAFEAVLATFR